MLFDVYDIVYKLKKSGKLSIVRYLEVFRSKCNEFIIQQCCFSSGKYIFSIILTIYQLICYLYSPCVVVENAIRITNFNTSCRMRKIHFVKLLLPNWPINWSGTEYSMYTENM